MLRLGRRQLLKQRPSMSRAKGRHLYQRPCRRHTRTATARIVLDNKDGRWRPGMFVTAELVAEEIQVPVAVSVDAFRPREWAVVFGRYGEYFEARPLELGRSDGQDVGCSRILRRRQYAAGNSFVIKAELGKSGASHDH